MAFVIGMDEAGYGPNLGPLVIGLTVWEIPNWRAVSRFWDVFADCITRDTPCDGRQLQVNDSKVVHDPARGLERLEPAVLAGWQLCSQPVKSLLSWWPAVTGQPPAVLPEPWFQGHDIDLPRHHSPQQIDDWKAGWQSLCEQHGFILRKVQTDLVLTRRFNELTTEYGSKGQALSRLSLKLLESVLPLTRGERTLVLADKHGGRNRYDELLGDIAGDDFLFTLEEGRELSRYKFGNVEVRFQTRSEAHLPVALASMFCKYLREAAMELFNLFWQKHVPGINPTKGYPTDARRFREEITVAQKTLGIADVDLWRER